MRTIFSLFFQEVKLPDGQRLAYRMDYVVRETGNTYIAAVTSHTTYWSNIDVANFMLSKLHPELEQYSRQNANQSQQQQPPPASTATAAATPAAVPAAPVGQQPLQPQPVQGCRTNGAKNSLNSTLQQ